MRNLYITRKRALACFGVLYHCILGASQEEHLAWVETQNREELMCDIGNNAIRNGETICVEIGEQETSLFVIAYLEKRNLMTQTVLIPEGTEDLRACIVTDYDGNRKLAMHVVPGGMDN